MAFPVQHTVVGSVPVNRKPTLSYSWFCSGDQQVNGVETRRSDMARKNLIRRAIENFAEYRGCTVRKWGSAYAIHDEAGMPLARLRPHPEGGFEIDYWSRQR